MQESTRALSRVERVGLLPECLTADEYSRYAYLNPVLTRMLVAGNGRAWAELLRKRLCTRAAAEIRCLAYKIALEFREIDPLVYACCVPDCEYCQEKLCV